ncbi:MAG: lipid kinase [Mastigocoleus sp. MO_167.B18]|nr:lipid kinase [Mastigocoleus sp. MO_167.B18]
MGKSKRQRALLLAISTPRQSRKRLSEAIGYLQRSGLEVIAEYPEQPQDISELIQTNQDEVDLVIIAGGDGTLNAGVDALIETKLPLGVLPLGSSNDLAKTLGIPKNLNQACKIIIEGDIRHIDLGCVNGKHFFNFASLGLSVDITQKLTKNAKLPLGIFSYFGAVIQAILKSRPLSVKISPNKPVIQTVQIVVGNGLYYGGSKAAVENARIDDQKLDFYLLEIEHWWEIFSLLPVMRSGNFVDCPQIRSLQTRQIRVDTGKPCPINTDGEITIYTPATFRVIPKALPVLVPAKVKR